jgi:hypothetical protein
MAALLLDMKYPVFIDAGERIISAGADSYIHMVCAQSARSRLEPRTRHATVILEIGWQSTGQPRSR